MTCFNCLVLGIYGEHKLSVARRNSSDEHTYTRGKAKGLSKSIVCIHTHTLAFALGVVALFGTVVRHHLSGVFSHMVSPQARQNTPSNARRNSYDEHTHARRKYEDTSQRTTIQRSTTDAY